MAFAGVTNYEAAVFIKRPQDVRDKTILVSDPVWLHQLYPSAFACWLTFMEQARLRHPGAYRHNAIMLANGSSISSGVISVVHGDHAWGDLFPSA